MLSKLFFIQICSGEYFHMQNSIINVQYNLYIVKDRGLQIVNLSPG